MTSQDDFLKKLIKVLDDCSIPYMISGSFGSSYHGQPRATKDIDIVIAPTEKQLLEFVESLGDDYYVSLEAVRDAFASNSMFNIIDSLSGWKADFILRKARTFSRQEFKRRGIAEIGGLDVWVTSPEDIILSKLEWFKDSQSEQQFGDALGVAVVQWDSLDVDYLRKWAKELQVRDSLEQLLKQAGRLVKEDDTSA
jgi:predicted nucleotidyltransferase